MDNKCLPLVVELSTGDMILIHFNAFYKPARPAGIAQRGVDALAVDSVLFRMGRMVIVERDAETGEIRLMLFADLADQLLRRNAFLLGTQHDRGAVGVVGADVMTFVAATFLEAHPDIGLDILQQMAQVDRAVGIRQSAGDEDLARERGVVRHGDWNIPVTEPEAAWYRWPHGMDRLKTFDTGSTIKLGRRL